MDPDTALREIGALVRASDRGEAIDVDRLVELVNELDKWVSAVDFLPEDWDVLPEDWKR